MTDEKLNADQEAARALLREFENGGGVYGDGPTLERREFGDEIVLLFTLRTGTVLRMRDVERPENLKVTSSKAVLNNVSMFAAMGRAATLELWMGDGDRREAAALIIGAIANYARLLRSHEMQQNMIEEVGTGEHDNDCDEVSEEGLLHLPEAGGKGSRTE